MGIGLYRDVGVEVGSVAVVFMVWQWACQADVNYNSS